MISYAAGAAVLAAFLPPSVEGAQASTGKSTFWVDVSFTGDGYVMQRLGAETALTSAAFWTNGVEEATSSSGYVNLVPSGSSGDTEGYATLQYKDALKSCTANYELLSQLHPSDTAGGGVSLFTSQDHGYLPDPGKDGVVMGAIPPWSEYVRISPSYPGCSSTSAELLSDLTAAWGSKEVECVLTPTKKHCSQTLRTRKSIPDTGGGTETMAGYGQMTASRWPSYPITFPDPIFPEIMGEMIKLLEPPDIQIIRKNSYPPTITRFPTILIPPKIDDGQIDGQIYIAKQPIVTTKGSVKHGTSVALPLSWDRGGVAALSQITEPTLVTVTLTYTSTGGQPVTQSENVYVLPATSANTTSPPPSTSASISSVDFSGGAANPTITVHGTDLGTLPQPSPAGHPAGIDGCPANAQDNGYDYGTSLYIALPAQNWAGGRYRPTLNELDCVDLVVTKFTSTEVVFHFGPFYTSLYPKFSLAPGSQVEIAVNGASLAATVQYG